jgi:hypothetical protein|nr:MAG TPA: hypothetical protein [Caudoviricetes sp.]
MKHRPMNISEQIIHYPSGSKEFYFTISMGEYAVLEDLNISELFRLQRIINSVASKYIMKGGPNEK